MKSLLKTSIFCVILITIFSAICCANIKSFFAGFGSRDLNDLTWIPINPELYKEDYIPKYRERGYYVLPDHNQRELEKTVKINLDGQEFRENNIYFIKHELIDASGPGSSAAYNKALVFSFAGPLKREFIPDFFFSVYLDDKDVSDQVYYRSSIDNHLTASFSTVQGIYKPQGYIDAKVKHTIKIILKEAEGVTYKREIPFEIPDIGLKEMKTAGFGTSLKGKEIKIEDETLIPLGRIIEYDPHDPYKQGSYSKDRSPFLPDDFYQPVEDHLKEVMGNIAALPNDSLLFLEAGDKAEGKSNPPSLYFYYIAPYGDFVMSSVTSVFIDEVDVTSRFAFNQFGRQHLKFDLCSGFYNKPEFLDPSKEHTYKIVLTMGDGNKYYREIKFTVPEEEVIRLQFEGLPLNQDPDKRPHVLRDRLQFYIMLTSDKKDAQVIFSSQGSRHPGISCVTINEEDITNSKNWIFRIEDGQQLPPISIIELRSWNWCTVYFETALPNVEIFMSAEINLPNGIKSNICTFTVPVTY